MFKALKTIFTMPIIMFFIVFILIGCSGGDFATVMCYENNTNDTMEMSYKSFKGHKFNSIKLKKDDELHLKIDVTTKKGDLKVALLDEDDNELFSVENPEEQITKAIKIDKDETYRIKVEGKHSGSYKINWDIKKA